MSLWDRIYNDYLAPGDERERRRRQDPVRAEEQLKGRLTPRQPDTLSASQRTRRQATVLYGGLALTTLSLLVTRRALRRKHATVLPGTFTPSNGPPPPIEGPFEAAEALGLATLNTLSMAVFAVGAAMTVFDIGDMREMREKLRQAAGIEGVNVGGGVRGDAGKNTTEDAEIEAWITEMLTKKDSNLRAGVLDKLKEVEEKEKKRAAKEKAL